jgi:hypothetical protein
MSGFYFSAQDVRSIQTRLMLSNEAFAELLGVTPVTAERWLREGTSRQSLGTRLALLQELLSSFPRERVLEMVGSVVTSDTVKTYIDKGTVPAHVFSFSWDLNTPLANRIVKLLPKYADVSIARMVGCSLAFVVWIRRKTRIPSFPKA